MPNQPHHPQRLTPPARPGELLKRLRDVKIVRDLEATTDRAHLFMVRGCVCLKCGMDPAGEAAHIRRSSPAHAKFNGMGAKPADRYSLPLCAGCHRQDHDALHRIGESLFFHILGIDPLLVAEKLYAQRGDLVAMRAVVFAAIAGRGSRRD